MKLDYLKEKKELVSVVLLGVSAFLAVLILIKATSFFLASANAENLVKKALAQSKLDAKDQEKYFAESKAIADFRLGKKILKTIRKWLNSLRVKTLFIEPGSPWENGYIESFNGKLRDKLLNREIFSTLTEAKILIEQWLKSIIGFDCVVLYAINHPLLKR